MGDNEIGSIILFGDYDWRILDIQDNTALIITENIIEQRSYNNFKGDVTWEKCSLRTYLNNDLYNQFSASDQSRIIQVLNKNDNNQWYGSHGGEDTLDCIFLLSIEDVVCKFFGDSSKILYNPTASQRYWFSSNDENNFKRKSIFNGYEWWWWLRSSGRDNRRAVYIHNDGNVGIQGNGTFRYNSKFTHPSTSKNYGGVRPALWLKL